MRVEELREPRKTRVEVDVLVAEVEKVKLLKKGGRVCIAVYTSEKGWEVVLWAPLENVFDSLVREGEWGQEEIEWAYAG